MLNQISTKLPPEKNTVNNVQNQKRNALLVVGLALAVIGFVVYKLFQANPLAFSAGDNKLKISSLFEQIIPFLFIVFIPLAAIKKKKMLAETKFKQFPGQPDLNKIIRIIITVISISILASLIGFFIMLFNL